MIKRPSMNDVLKNRIRTARGEIAPDLILKDGRVINVFIEAIETYVAISDGVVVETVSYKGEKCLDARGHYDCPGFIDGHFHSGSTMLTAPELPGWFKYL
jgi:adenine deaminase